MNEHTIFAEALDRGDPAARSAYLDEACAGDPALRARVEALLRSHEQAGDFLGKLAPQQLAEQLAADPGGSETRTEPAAASTDEPLDFLAPSDAPGSLGRLGHYEIQEVVGRGGMGVVLKAFDDRLHRVVAIKVMAPQLATSATARRRFAREARAAAAVTHDHIVTIHAVEDVGPLPHIVMQFVAGSSLHERLDRTGPLQLHEVLRIGMQTASGLAAAHAQGLVHRDVKPANILLENGVERVKLTDFGLARAADDASLTQSGTIAGTPSFMSPEQAEGKPVDQRSDLFSLGSVLYVMCTGRPPFRASTSMGVLKRVCEGVPTPIRETNAEIPDWLVAVVEKLHAKDPAARFQSAAEVAELLGRHLARVQHPSVVALPAVVKTAEVNPAPARRSSGSRRWAAAAAVLVAMLAILGTTEATGVTKVRGTVIRFFTPDGTLVVETDDPGVKVVIEGDGDLVITGTGAQEVRLRAGSYRLKATRDGKPVKLDRDLVAISRGDRQIVRVRMEGDAPTAVVPKAEPVIDPDRKAAEYVLSIGGEVCVNEEYRYLKATAELPPEPLRLTSVYLTSNKQVTNAGLAAFQECKNLRCLYLGVTQVSNAGLVHFKDCKNLMILWLHHTQVSDAGLAHFKECSNLTSLHLACTQVGDAGLANFKGCKNLTQLDLEKTKVSDAGLAHFQDCNLDHLGLNFTRVGDAGLAHLKTRKNLTRLRLRNTGATDEGLSYFQDCKNLTQLILGGTQVSNAGLAHFKDCKDLITLALDNTRVTDAGLAHFRDCKSLKTLGLDNIRVSDDGLGYFKDCKSLTELTLSETQVSDGGLKHLAGLKNLNSLDLRRTRVTTAGVAELQKALPKCKIDGG